MKKLAVAVILGVVMALACFSSLPTVEAGNTISDTTIKKIGTYNFSRSSKLFDNYNYTYDMYLDKVTNTCYARFSSNYHGVIIELLDKDNKPKIYSESNYNKLDLIESGDFLVFEDMDTGIQYIVASDFSDYTVRKTVSVD